MQNLISFRKSPNSIWTQQGRKLNRWGLPNGGVMSSYHITGQPIVWNIFSAIQGRKHTRTQHAQHCMHAPVLLTVKPPQNTCCRKSSSSNQPQVKYNLVSQALAILKHAYSVFASGLEDHEPYRGPHSVSSR